jgi:hypothetical protein
MHARIIRQFRMESGGERSSLPDGDRNILVAFGGDDFDVIPYLFDFRRADENHFEGRAWVRVERALQELAFADRAVDLASVGVAADADIDRAQAGLRGVFDFGGE